jgi:peptide deformylase
MPVTTREERRAAQKEAQRKDKKARAAGRALLVPGDHPALKTVSTPVVFGEDLSFVETMLTVLRVSTNGVGLAANQIGVTKRVIVIWDRARQEKPVVMLNPVITRRSDRLHSSNEGCLSYPGVDAWLMRHDEVDMTWTTLEGTEESGTFYRRGADVAQHEMDHLDGVCLVGDYGAGWRDPKHEEYMGRKVEAGRGVARSLPAASALVASMALMAANYPSIPAVEHLPPRPAFNRRGQR